MALSDVFAADAVALMSPEEGGEEILYRPASGASRTVRALVSRAPLVPNEPGRKASANRVFELVIPKGDDGVDVVQKSLDIVEIAPVRGAAAEEMRVVEVLAEGLGSWRLKVRR